MSLCPSTPADTEREARLKTLVVALLASSVLSPGGGIIDAGANDGGEACLYATLAPGRPVLAVEPVAANVAVIQQRYGHLSNLRVVLAGLGAVPGRLEMGHVAKGLGGGVRAQLQNKDGASRPSVGRARQEEHSNTSVPIHTIDALFSAAEPLAFAHLDLEGAETQVLRGAQATLLRDRPLFSVEMFPHTREARATAALLEAVAQAGYVAFLVEESCGLPLDCRNVLCVPRERLSAFEAVAAVAAAAAEGWLVRVDASSVGRHGFPCCAKGGACCNDPKGRWWRCCHPIQLYEWVVASSSRPGEPLAACPAGDAGSCAPPLLPSPALLKAWHTAPWMLPRFNKSGHYVPMG